MAGLDAASTPLGHGHIALGLALHDVEAPEALRALRREAAAVQAAGFHGLSMSEHHLGYPGYVPNPVQAVATLLGGLELTDGFWGAPCPVLLPLRDAALVAEDLAWLAAWFPGAVGAGVAPGYHTRDFELFGADVAARGAVFGERLGELTGMFRGRQGHRLAQDPAVARLADLPEPFPMVMAVGSVAAVRRAVDAGVGLLLSPSASVEQGRQLTDAYRAHGGTGPVVFIRRVWLGPGSPEDAVARRLAGAYKDASADAASWMSGAHYTSGEAGAVVDALLQQVEAAGATALNLRVHALEVDHQATLAQIGLLGEQVLEDLGTGLASLVGDAGGSR